MTKLLDGATLLKMLQVGNEPEDIFLFFGRGTRLELQALIDSTEAEAFLNSPEIKKPMPS